MPTLKEQYKEKALPSMMKVFGRRNPMALPRLRKVVLSTGVGVAKDDARRDHIVKSLALLAGAKPSPRPAKISIASFKVREGQVVGYAVTLRGKRMYDFLEKLLRITIPRIRDFRGLDPAIIDVMGNLTIGFRDHTVFPEVSEEDVRSAFGLAVTITTSAKNHTEGRVFLKPSVFLSSKKTVGKRRMAKKSVIARAKRPPKYLSRVVRRCFRCGRKRAYMRDFDLCRICFRELANEGMIPGVKKSSW